MVSFFALIVLALGGHLISVETDRLGLYFNYAALGVATGVLSFGVPAMYGLSANSGSTLCSPDYLIG